MFKSESGIVIPQFEHARLAGVLASAWGNKYFDRPAMTGASFNTGNYFHDRGFGYAPDNHQIGAMPLEAHLDILRSGFFQQYDDKIADIVAKMHMRRLLLMNKDRKSTQTLLDEMDLELARVFRENNDLKEEVFTWADKITEACDNISFDWCFGQPAADNTEVFMTHQSHMLNKVNYQVHKNPGQIKVCPWPFNKNSLSGTIIGYREQGYPEMLEPVLLPYTVIRGKPVPLTLHR